MNSDMPKAVFRQGVERGAADERAVIVTWLRSEWDRAKGPPPLTYDELADAIERGAHLAEPANPKKLRTFTFAGGADRATVKWTPDGLDVFHNGQQVDTSWTPDLGSEDQNK